MEINIRVVTGDMVEIHIKQPVARQYVPAPQVIGADYLGRPSLRNLLCFSL